jgi:uncharacterized membrane protein YhaH (DUF805 family)
MQALRFLLSPSGRMGPQAFAVAVAAVYAAGAASQLLTMPDVMARRGIWLFAALQALLTWVWFAIHAKRLRDAGRASGLAAAASLLYALSIVLLLIVAAAFFTASSGATDTNSALGLILLVAIIATLSGSSNYDIAWLMAAMLTVVACLPIIVAVAVTLWAATRPSVTGSAA